MVMVNSIKRSVTAMMLVMLMLGFMSVIAPMKVHATSGSIGDINVTVGNNGSLTLKGIDNTGGSAGAWNSFIAKYKNFIVGVAGVGAVSMILFFVLNFMKLGATASNPKERATVISGLIFSGIAAAGLGAVSIFVGIFYNMLR